MTAVYRVTVGTADDVIRGHHGGHGGYYGGHHGGYYYGGNGGYSHGGYGHGGGHYLCTHHGSHGDRHAY